MGACQASCSWGGKEWYAAPVPNDMHMLPQPWRSGAATEAKVADQPIIRTAGLRAEHQLQLGQSEANLDAMHLTALLHWCAHLPYRSRISVLSYTGVWP
jgi:hypothetical protein